MNYMAHLEDLRVVSLSKYIGYPVELVEEGEKTQLVVVSPHPIWGIPREWEGLTVVWRRFNTGANVK